MTVDQDGGRTLAAYYLTMLDVHGPNAVDDLWLLTTRQIRGTRGRTQTLLDVSSRSA